MTRPASGSAKTALLVNLNSRSRVASRRADLVGDLVHDVVIAAAVNRAQPHRRASAGQGDRGDEASSRRVPG